MKIAIANDHRGFFMKEEIGKIVSELGHDWADFGCSDEQPVDYPDIAYVTAMAVAKKEVDRAILICSVGIGMCIAANKVKGVRAVTCYDEIIARISRTQTTLTYFVWRAI